ncbi:conserved hypothetical protein [Hahella chejuensis KCTC 2396]|uniref:Tetrapyrrole methylase domain-containing protein n=1 Tax=Hahella chejuensis (strain KCTC 2396) TaxID=349521 RepID=Q2SHF5_HAHCH|nr:SAM-dependent methyltransferase [Hahella chejuensis]ABC29919.1 conserved hypothetical protein [Hahella chejuensis KCTC 2396]
MASAYPKYEEHQKHWEELAQGIAALRDKVREVEEGEIPAGSKQGELIILGTGIETIGVSVGDIRLIEEADKVLYCVADPATVVWLKQLRPDALDLYVLYGEDKVRYTTYMQMTEAQLYWVREGLKVVVVFYGHPGVFVLSTHRAIKLARREGYKATMKAGVCALDTLCSDLGIDPCYPGLQTHEATDCLIRRRHLDASLHVVLWQVGLIGEMGYRRQGYLNNKFSYFIHWLQSVYGDDYEVTHYIGSRYPTIDPVIETYKLSALHNPEIQIKITGLSTFYIPPMQAVPTDYQTAVDLGVIEPGQKLLTPRSPLREIDRYGPREMKAFDAFKRFRIPASYQWQDQTAASRFLIELRFDTRLQDLYRRDPLAALEDPRFSGLSDRERAMLASRDSGAIQIAAKGAYIRSPATEAMVTACLTQKSFATGLMRALGNLPKAEARVAFEAWLASRGHQVEWGRLGGAVDFIFRNNLYPWTGIYIEPEQRFVITIIGARKHRHKSILYINDQRIRSFAFEAGAIRWKANAHIPHHGFLRLDIDANGGRRLIGKIWSDASLDGAQPAFVAAEANPERKALSARACGFSECDDLRAVYGEYAVRTDGRFHRDINQFTLSETGLTINQRSVPEFSFSNGALRWRGGDKACHQGEATFLRDPIINTIELYGVTRSNEEDGAFTCYGSSIVQTPPAYCGPSLPDWAAGYVADIVYRNSSKGGLLLWHKWEKFNLTTLIVNRYLTHLL